MKKLNKKFFGIFLSVAMIFGGVVAVNAQIKTYKVQQNTVNVEESYAKDVKEASLALVRAYIIDKLSEGNSTIFHALNTNITGANLGSLWLKDDYIDINDENSEDVEGLRKFEENLRKFEQGMVDKSKFVITDNTQLDFIKKKVLSSLEEKKEWLKAYLEVYNNSFKGKDNVDDETYKKAYESLINRFGVNCKDNTGVEFIKKNLFNEDTFKCYTSYLSTISEKIEAFKKVKLDDVKGLENKISIHPKLEDVTSAAQEHFKKLTGNK